MRKLVVLLALAVGLGAFIVAEEEESSGAAQLSKVSLGQHWYGPQVDLEELKGRVVMLEFWGFN